MMHPEPTCVWANEFIAKKYSQVQATVPRPLREDDPSKTLEKQYRAIAAAATDELDELISRFDPRHTLELDIAR